MPVRLKITLSFALIMMLIFSLLCGTIYYFVHAMRVENIKTHLKNRALITARMLSQPAVFDNDLMKKMDSAVLRSFKQKSIQVYNSRNERMYAYSDVINDTLKLTRELLDDDMKMKYFDTGHKEAIIFKDTIGGERILILTAAFDEGGKSSFNNLRIILLVSFFTAIVVALFSGYFISGYLLRPIRKIADEVNIISANSLTTRIKTGRGNDEWRYLTETLNNLLNRLQESFEIQRRFISSASHELSTPLTSISSQLEVSLQRNRAAEDYRAVMQSVYQDVQQLNQLTQTLLQFASMSGTAGGIELNLVRIDEILMRLPAEMTKANKGYSVNLKFDKMPSDEKKLLVYGSEDLLFSAIKNIVSNACKYSLDKLANVSLFVRDLDVLIQIEDNGKGIPQNEVENIFQPFYRTEDSRATIGFGVGLPLVNRIVKMHKGHIEVSSKVGEGTTFFVYLPIAGSI